MYKMIAVALQVGLAGPAGAPNLPADSSCMRVMSGAPPSYDNTNGFRADQIFEATPSACLVQQIVDEDAKRGHVQMVRGELNPSELSRPRPRTPRTELDYVIARYSERLMLDPKDDDAYFRRGIANFYAGFASNAMADIDRARELDPSYPYYAVWLHIIHARIGMPSHLAEDVAHIDMTKWPAPIVKLLLGQMAASEVEGAAADVDITVQAGQTCEAAFYIGQIALQKNSIKEAEHWLRLAALECPQDFVEGPAARAELRKLGEGR